MLRSIGIALSLAIVAAPVRAATPPAVLPGGANQTAGVSGSLGQTLFNGKLRLRGLKFAAAAPSDHAGPLETLVLHGIVSNGTSRSTHGYFNASLADADGITVTGRVVDDGWDLQPGAAARMTYGFALPPNFTPTKLVLIEAAGVANRAFRFTLKPADVPAAPAPAAT
ncbi:MAG: hypothetical protein NVS2B8_04430 [Vulcanimicrobiaceae bacterium]